MRQDTEILEFPSLREHSSFERANQVVIILDRAVQRATQLLQVIDHWPETLMKLRGLLADLLCLLESGVLLPSVCHAPQQSHQRRRGRRKYAIPDRVIEQGRRLFVRCGEQVFSGNEADRKVNCSWDLRWVVPLRECSYVTRHRFRMRSQVLTAILLCRRRHDAREVIQRELCINNEAPPACEFQHYIGPGSVGYTNLYVKVSVLGHARFLKEVLQHELSSPAALGSIREHRCNPFNLDHRGLKLSLDLTLRLQDARNCLRALSPNRHPDDPCAREYPNYERDDHSYHSHSFLAG